MHITRQLRVSAFETWTCLILARERDETRTGVPTVSNVARISFTMIGMFHLCHLTLVKASFKCERDPDDDLCV
jgi:hypothetical protein